jgi:RecB family exonuclease
MRGAVIRAAEDMRGEPVEAVELEFDTMVGDVKLTGTIDRLDRYPAGQLVRDYKTGKPKNEAAMKEDVQLDTYLLAMEDAVGAVFEHVRQGEAVGFVIEEIADRVHGRKVDIVTRADLAARREAMRRLVAEVADEARGGRLAVKPRDPELCERGRCDGFDLCRVQRARWLAKAAREPAE